MDYTTLGRTGIRVSVAGLGCGGFSQLGLGTGKSEADAIGIIRGAIDLGVNLFDTAAAYGTEKVLAKALRGVPRDRVVICTKALLREKEKGKFRHLGISETAPGDPGHEMAQRACRDGVWDVLMCAFHMMHQNAREAVFPMTRQHGVGTLMMFAVRNIFSRPERLAATMRELAADGEVPQALADNPDPLGFLVHAGGATSVIDAAYRFVRHEPGVDVVLFGTGDP